MNISAHHEEFAAAGLLRGLDEPAQKRRVVMLSRLLDAGFPMSQLVTATKEGRLAHLLMRDALIGRGPRYTLEEIASLAELPIVDVERWFRAMGRGVANQVDPAYSDEDLRLAQVLVEYRDLGLDDIGLFASARILGRNLWAMSDAIESLVGKRLSGPGDHLEVALRLASEVTRLAEFQASILAHLVAMRLESSASADYTSHVGTAQDLAVCFADLVGFTSIGEVAAPTELAELAERLDLLTTESLEPPVRFVKTVGDAVMLISPDPNALARTVQRIFSAASATTMPPLHAGIAWGPALPRAGDWIGRTVNLASRIAAVAGRGTILVDSSTFDRLDQSVLFCEPAGTFALKGYESSHDLYILHRQSDTCAEIQPNADLH
jgi:adenylate cyclase